MGRGDELDELAAIVAETTSATVDEIRRQAGIGRPGPQRDRAIAMLMDDLAAHGVTHAEIIAEAERLQDQVAEGHAMRSGPFRRVTGGRT